LRSLLLVVALSGPLLFFAYSRYLKPEFRYSGGVTWTIDNEAIPRYSLHIIARHTRSTKRAIIAIVTPANIGIDVGGEHRLTKSNLRGICVREDKVFINGKRFLPSSIPCFLVFNPQTESFIEVPFRSRHSVFANEVEITNAIEWRQSVIPILETLKP
jgi:hypothetical protein